MRRRRNNRNLLYAIIVTVGLLLAIGALALVGIMGSSNNRNRMKEAVNQDNSAALMAITTDMNGKKISKEIYEGYKEDIKKAVFNELNGNGGANSNVRVEYDGFLVKKPVIVIEEYTIDIKDIGPELIIMVNDKEIKHGNEKNITVVGIPGENIIRFSMNQGFYNDAGSTAKVTFGNGVTQAEINPGYGFQEFTIKVKETCMLVINGTSVLELKPGDNTVNLPTNLHLMLSVVDPVNNANRSPEVQLVKETPSYSFEIEKKN